MNKWIACSLSYRQTQLYFSVERLCTALHVACQMSSQQLYDFDLACRRGEKQKKKNFLKLHFTDESAKRKCHCELVSINSAGWLWLSIRFLCFLAIRKFSIFFVIDTRCPPQSAWVVTSRQLRLNSSLSCDSSKLISFSSSQWWVTQSCDCD